MTGLLKNIRFYVLLVSVLISVGIFFYINTTYSAPQEQIIQLEQIYAFLSIVYLYVTLLIGPLWYTFPWLPFKESFSRSRRALGGATFYFASLHVCLTFFGQLDGFRGVVFLDTNFLISLIIGFIAFIILFFLTITSVDYAVRKMHFKNWKLLHRLVYVSGILILVHTLLLGTHFSDLTSIISQITFFALAFLLLLEASRIDAWIGKLIVFPRFSLTTVIFLVFLGISYISYLSPFSSKLGTGASFDIHAAHKALAQLAAQQNSGQQFAVDITKLPGLDGDRNKRYTVSFSNSPQNPLPNQDITLHFMVNDASNGNPISYFKFIYAKKMHLIMVNSNLTYFVHLHPIQDGQGFSITTQFPTPDVYHIYVEFQPFGGIEQQDAFTLQVGNPIQVLTATQSAEPDITTKNFGPYAVTLNTNGSLNASDMSFGNQKLTFTIKNARTGKPITTLKPYLASFGHLTMINEQTYSFIHVHPYSLIVPPPNADSGPTVDFLPIGIYGPFSPVIYRVFAEFNPDNNLFTSNFTVKVN